MRSFETRFHVLCDVYEVLCGLLRQDSRCCVVMCGIRFVVMCGMLFDVQADPQCGIERTIGYQLANRQLPLTAKECTSR